MDGDVTTCGAAKKLDQSPPEFQSRVFGPRRLRPSQMWAHVPGHVTHLHFSRNNVLPLDPIKLSRSGNAGPSAPFFLLGHGAKTEQLR